MPSESKTCTSSNITVGGRAGRVPVAITILSALTRCSPVPSPAATATVCSSTKPAVPWSSATRLRESWSRTTSISRATTWWLRRERSSMVMFSFTR